MLAAKQLVPLVAALDFLGELVPSYPSLELPHQSAQRRLPRAPHWHVP